MSNLKMTVELVSGTDDDRAANVYVFQEAYDLFIAANLNLSDKIAGAVDAVFDEYPNKPIVIPSLVNAAMGHLTYSLNTFKSLSDSIVEYVRENADRTDRKDRAGNVISSAEADRTRKFKIGKGANGGVTRWSNVK